MGAMLREDLVYISSTLAELHFLLSWIGSCGELAPLYVADLTYYVRRRWSRLLPEKYCRLHEISRGTCDAWFQLTPYELRRLFDHLCFPTELRKTDQHLLYNDRHTYNSKHAFIFYCITFARASLSLLWQRRFLGEMLVSILTCLTSSTITFIYFLQQNFWNKFLTVVAAACLSLPRTCSQCFIGPCHFCHRVCKRSHC